MLQMNCNICNSYSPKGLGGLKVPMLQINPYFIILEYIIEYILIRSTI